MCLTVLPSTLADQSTLILCPFYRESLSRCNSKTAASEKAFESVPRKPGCTGKSPIYLVHLTKYFFQAGL